MMQIIVHPLKRTLKVEEVPAPALHAQGLLVANHVSLISPGTEKATATIMQKTLAGKAMNRPEMVKRILDKIHKDGLIDSMRRVFDRLDTPTALGYSCAGTVCEVGPKVGAFSVGDRVACAGQNYASHAEVVYVPKHLCVKIPEGVEFEDASFVTLGAIALQGVRQAETRLGERVAVIGLGLLGQLTVQLLKASGCQVLGSDLDPSRNDLARSLGADAVAIFGDLTEAVMAFTEGRGVDAVIIAANTRENGPVQIAGAITRKKGRVVVVGAVGMTIPREAYYLKEIELRLSTSYGPGRYDPDYEERGRDYPFGYVRWTENRNMEAFLSLLQQRKVGVKPLVTHRFPIQDAEQAYVLLKKNTEPHLGILISYPCAETGPNLGRVIAVAAGKRLGQLNLGIIGAGHHVRDSLLPCLLEWKAVQVRALCTATGSHAKVLAEKTQTAYCTTDYREILKDETIQAVLIGTRHDSHAEIVIEALHAGKHVFVEKPLCLTEEELDRIATLYREKASEGIQIMVGFNRRFSPHAEKARAFFSGRRESLVMSYRVNAGALPEDHWIQDPEVGGGRILGEACHFVDYMQSLCGAPPVAVYAQRVGCRIGGPRDEQSVLSLTFGDGSIGAVVYVAGGDPGLPKERFEVFGDGKALTMDDFEVTEFYAKGQRGTYRSGKRDKGFQEEMNHLVTSLTRGDGAAMRFHEIEAVTRACLLAAKSLRTGRPYEIPGTPK
jgi:predicted dehydrogenase/threonine dehydrogenase-like Zn-dependent dehydrogenase